MTNIEELICHNKNTKMTHARETVVLLLEETYATANPVWTVSRFPFFIAFLNQEKVFICRITGGFSSQILGPK